MLYAVRQLFISLMLLMGLASVASAAPSSSSSSDDYLLRHISLVSNPPVSSYYTTSRHDPTTTSRPDPTPTSRQDPAVPSDPDVDPDSEERPPQIPEQPRYEAPPAPDRSTSPGIILTPKGTADSGGWSAFTPTSTVLTFQKDRALCGEEMTFTVSVSPPSATGIVQLFVDGSPLGTPVPVVQGVATLRGVLDLPPGPHFISADYSGDDTHGMSTAPLQKLLVKKDPQEISFPPLPDVVPESPSFAPGAAATSGLPVSYISSNPSVIVVAGGVVSIAGTGTAMITATQEGNECFLPAAPVSRTVTVSAPQKR